PGAKFVKDIAAGAVLVAAITAAVVGATIFLGAMQLEVSRERMLHPSTVPQVVGAFLLLMVAVLVIKVLAGKGTLLQGGVVSGHSAAAFFLATVVVVLVPHPLVAALVFLLAGIVAQSRVEAGIHTLREVVIGAVAALAIAVAVLRGPVWLARLLPDATRSVPGGSGR
ncbi:MAG: diacylglycerol kinase, partial [Armatimonadota bacterium]